MFLIDSYDSYLELQPKDNTFGDFIKKFLQ